MHVAEAVNARYRALRQLPAGRRPRTSAKLRYQEAVARDNLLVLCHEAGDNRVNAYEVSQESLEGRRPQVTFRPAIPPGLDPERHKDATDHDHGLSTPPDPGPTIVPAH